MTMAIDDPLLEVEGLQLQASDSTHGKPIDLQVHSLVMFFLIARHAQTSMACWQEGNVRSKRSFFFQQPELGR